MMALILSDLKPYSLVILTGRPKLNLDVPNASRPLLQPHMALGGSGESLGPPDDIPQTGCWSVFTVLHNISTR